MATLSIQIPSGENLDFPITGKSTVIGRDDTCDLVINNSYISSKHAIVHQSEEGTFLIEDQESTHGVLVNGQRIVAEKLTDGDMITLGQLDIVLHVNGSAPATPAPANIPAPMSSPRPQPAAPAPTPHIAAPMLKRRPSAEPPAQKQPSAAPATATPMRRPTSPSSTQPMPGVEKSSAPAPMRPIPKTTQPAPVAGTPTPSRLPTQKKESGPRTGKVASTADLKTAKTDLQSEVSELKQKLTALKEEENEKRNLYQDSLEDMRVHIAELGQDKRKLRDEVEDLRDRHRSVQSRVDDEDDAFLPVMFEVVKRVDLLEGMISAMEASGSAADETLTQLKTLHASFDDLFERHHIRTESLEPGTQLNMGLRRRIRIVDASGNAAEEAPRPDTSANHKPSQSKVTATVRPGIVYSPEGGEEVLLRKIEVTVEEA